MPLGGKGVAMVDTRDIAEVAALELIHRDQAPGRPPRETLNLVGPDTLTGAGAAAIWSELLGRPSIMPAPIPRASNGAWRPRCRPGWPTR